jgi:hypothetical protein
MDDFVEDSAEEQACRESQDSQYQNDEEGFGHCEKYPHPPPKAGGRAGQPARYI